MRRTTGSQTGADVETVSRPYRLLLLLAVTNFANFYDRQLLSALAEPVKHHFGLSDFQLGVLNSCFEVSYPLAALALGVVADRGMRNRVIAFAVAVWSVATVLTGAAGSYLALALSRVGLGLGCGGYGPAGLALLSDAFPGSQRSRVVALHDSGLMLGAALGYVLGGTLGEAFGWRMPFLVAGIPGLALAVLAWNVREPPRGASEYASLGLEGDSCSPGLGGCDLAAGAGDAEPREGGAGPHGSDSERQGAGSQGLSPWLFAQLPSVVRPVRQLLAVPTLRVVYAADVLIALASGGLIFWMPSFLVRAHGLGVGRAGLVTGILQVAAGLAGMLAGGWLADKWTQRHPGGRMLTMGVGFVVGTPLAIVAFLAPDLGLFCVAAGLAVICYTVYFPCLAPQIHDVTPPGLRATALGVNILLGHVLGNLFSTPLIGWLSDATGDLRVAMLAVPLVALLAGLAALRGARSAGPDRRRMLADLAAHLS